MDTKDHMLSKITVHLLKGVIFRHNSPDLWQNLLNLYALVNDRAALLGLECIIDEAEGYAYFKQRDDESEISKIPPLIQKRQLSYPVSLLCVLLRKKILESDSGGDSIRVIINKEQIIEMMILYMPDTTNEVKMTNRIISAMNRIIDMGFAKVLDDEKGVYEIQRILKAFVDAQWIASLDQKLDEYRKYNYDNRE